MGDYRGTVWIVGDDRAVTHVVDGTFWFLPSTDDNLGDWGGRLEGEADWWALTESAEPLTIQVGERTGSVLITNHDPGTDFVIVAGSGPSPFG